MAAFKSKTDNLANDIGKLEDSDYLSFLEVPTTTVSIKKIFSNKGDGISKTFKTYFFQQII